MFAFLPDKNEYLEATRVNSRKGLFQRQHMFITNITKEYLNSVKHHFAVMYCPSC